MRKAVRCNFRTQQRLWDVLSGCVRLGGEARIICTAGAPGLIIQGDVKILNESCSSLNLTLAWLKNLPKTLDSECLSANLVSSPHLSHCYSTEKHGSQNVIVLLEACDSCKHPPAWGISVHPSSSQPRQNGRMCRGCHQQGKPNFISTKKEKRGQSPEEMRKA